MVRGFQQQHAVSLHVDIGGEVIAANFFGDHCASGWTSNGFNFRDGIDSFRKVQRTL